MPKSVVQNGSSTSLSPLTRQSKKNQRKSENFNASHNQSLSIQSYTQPLTAAIEREHDGSHHLFITHTHTHHHHQIENLSLSLSPLSHLYNNNNNKNNKNKKPIHTHILHLLFFSVTHTKTSRSNKSHKKIPF